MSKLLPENRQRGFWTDFFRLRLLWPYLKQSKKFVILAAILIPFIGAMQSVRPIIFKWAIDDGIAQSNYKILWISGIGFFVAVLLEYLLRAGQTFVAAKAVFQMILRLRKKVVSHIIKLPASFHDKNMSGALVTRATSDFNNLSQSLNQGMLNAVVDVVVVISCLVAMFTLDAKLTLVTILILPIALIAISLFTKLLKRTMLRARSLLAGLNAFSQEMIYGQSTVKILSAQDDCADNFHKQNIKYRNAQMKSVIIDAILFAVLDSVAVVALGFVLWKGIEQISLGATNLTPGLLIAFSQFVSQIFHPLKNLGNKMAMLQGAFTAIERIFTVLEQPHEPDGTLEYKEIKNKIGFTNVSFAYNNNEMVLNGIDLIVSKNQSVAIVGATGSGKSTIVKLLMKQYPYENGSIKIDDTELKDIKKASIAKCIGYVPQDIVIFNGSIEYNITLGRDFSLAQVKQAANLVGLDKYVESLPDKYSSLVKERGSNISHGQRQLICFARALVSNPEIVILDEATASVDPISEQIIQNAVEEIFTKKTVIAIAHRLTTIRKCDNIYVVKEGKVIENGNYSNLINSKGHFFQLSESLE